MYPLERFVIWNKQTTVRKKGAGDTLLSWCRFEVSSLGGELIVGTSRGLSILLFPTATTSTVTPLPALKEVELGFWSVVTCLYVGLDLEPDIDSELNQSRNVNCLLKHALGRLLCWVRSALFFFTFFESASAYSQLPQDTYYSICDQPYLIS
jgi:hypothetical protein